MSLIIREKDELGTKLQNENTKGKNTQDVHKK